MGTLSPAKSADFVVLDANPLDDIRNTRKISRRLPSRREARIRAALPAGWQRSTANSWAPPLAAIDRAYVHQAMSKREVLLVALAEP